MVLGRDIRRNDKGRIEFTDNSEATKARMRDNIGRALVAMGVEGLGLILDTMNKGYERPIFLTGDLQRSMAYDVDLTRQEVTWGTNLEYGQAVHEGTATRAGRPFLTDGIMAHADDLREEAVMHLKEGF